MIQISLLGFLNLIDLIFICITLYDIYLYDF